jgi:hypothetical protein
VRGLGARKLALRLAAASALILLALAVAFALYTWRVMYSPFMLGLNQRSAAYSCIGPVLYPKHPNALPELQVARSYLLDGRELGPSLSWHFQFAVTIWAIEVATTRTEANRLHAALPNGWPQGFDGAALRYTGKSYCALDERRKQAILDYAWNGRRPRLEAAMGAGRKD